MTERVSPRVQALPQHGCMRRTDAVFDFVREAKRARVALEDDAVTANAEETRVNAPVLAKARVINSRPSHIHPKEPRHDGPPGKSSILSVLSSGRRPLQFIARRAA